MFGRKERRTPFQRDADDRLESLRDDCIALFINSGLTQREIHNRGGPTPATISKWLYKETRFPRYNSLQAFLLAIGHELMPVSAAVAQSMRDHGRASYLAIDTGFIGRPRMPQRKRRAA